MTSIGIIQKKNGGTINSTIPNDEIRSSILQ